MVILSALISITMALIYGVRKECVSSRVDGIVSLAGDSVLSEYNEDIQREYGLFMLKGTDRELSEKLRGYIEYSFEDMKDVNTEKVNVSGKRFSTANIDLIKDQILEYMKLAVAEDGFALRKDDTENKADGVVMENRTLRHGPTAVSLPSGAMPDKSLTAMAESAAENLSEIDNAFKKGTEKYLLNEYILRHFNSRSEVNSREHFFRNEVEYVLGGELSDRKNEKRVELALKAMRFTLDLAHIYSDEEKRAATMTMAEILTPGAPAMATQAALAATWAYAEADNDVELLWKGYKVPVVKDKSSWAVTLDNAVDGLLGETMMPKENKGYDYGQYLQILLFLKDENIKICRIMDLIQINMRASYDGDFLISEYATGISAKVRVNGRDYGYEKKY